MGADWKKIKAEYITTDISYRRLAQKHGIHYKVISERGKNEKWVELRQQHRDKTITKTLDKISDQQADKMARVTDLADQLLEKLERAIGELDLQMVTCTDKEKVIEYGNDRRPDKPTKETVHEQERLVETRGIVDRVGLRMLATALKDLKEVQDLRSALDDEEQRARIENLRKNANREDQKNAAITVVLEGDLKNYAQ